jgi:arsenate reductase-like glutaredoxin family protein
LQQHKAELEERDLGKQPLNAQELDRLIGSSSHLDFLNPKNQLYRSRNMKEHPPSRKEALHLMAQEPNLIRRPIVRRGNQWFFGFDAERLQALTK